MTGTSASDGRIVPHEPVPRAPAPHPLMDAGAAAMLLILIGAFIAPALAWVAWGGPFDGSPGRSFELRMLVWSALVSLLLPILLIGLEIRRNGGSAIRGNRDFYPRRSGVGARIARAHANAIESLAPFAAVVLAAHAAGVSNRWTVAASALYTAARATHALSYALGVTIVRSSAFYAGWIATATIAAVALRLMP
jgi:uncharacterized MAPEG superfamily protein